MADSNVPEVTVRELYDRRTRGDAPFLLDVRQPHEVALADLGADQLIPVEELAQRLNEIQADKDAEIVVHCRSGARSARAVELMRQHGFTNAANLKGGILAWSREIDASVPQY